MVVPCASQMPGGLEDGTAKSGEMAKPPFQRAATLRVHILSTSLDMLMSKKHHFFPAHDPQGSDF